jgi:hypothetical protein
VHTIGVRRVPPHRNHHDFSSACRSSGSGGDLGKCELVSIDIPDGTIFDATVFFFDIFRETDTLFPSVLCNGTYLLWRVVVLSAGHPCR